jgi:hypothetical protein
MAVAIGLGGIDKRLDFGCGQMLAGPQFRVRSAERSNCSDFWWLVIPMRGAVLPKEIPLAGIRLAE